MNIIEQRKRMRGQGGFTLIELLVVIAVLAVLGGAAIIGIGAMRGNAEAQVCKTDKETIELAAEAQKVDTGANTYVTTVAGLGTYIKKAPKGTWAIDATTGTATASAYGSLANPATCS